MKSLLSFYFALWSCSLFSADIAPNPILVHGIYTLDECKIQMVSEYVRADLYNDASEVSCTFDLQNFGDDTEIEVGFPEMNFHYWSTAEYSVDDKKNFKIYVDGKLLSENDIRVPIEMDSLYQEYMKIYYANQEYTRKLDSIYTANGVKHRGDKTIYPKGSYEKTEEALQKLGGWKASLPKSDKYLWRAFEEQRKKGNFPWYVWNVKFNKNENKKIKVVYSLPAGILYNKGRYFKYILETGSGWYNAIDRADIEIRLHGIQIKSIEEFSPSNYVIDDNKRMITWTFTNLEPTAADNIYIQYIGNSNKRNGAKRKRL
jgi:hypothetical protein